MDRRFIQLFELLAKSSEYVKSEELCEQLNIRPRTLRGDLRKYKDTIEQEAGAKIMSKPRMGYRMVVVDENKYNHFVSSLLQLESSNQYLIPVYQEERINYIIRYFLSHKEYIKINDLADLIYVSRSTLNMDLKEVKERISFFHLKLVSKASHGMKIEGKEKDIRSCMAQYFYHYDDYDQAYIQGINLSSEYIDHEAFDYIKTLLYDTIQQYHFKLTDFGFQNLTIHILIAINRIMQKTYVEEFVRFDEITNKEEMQIALALASSLNEHFHISIPKSEIHYIAIHLMGKQMLQYDQEHLVINQETMDLVNEILQELNRVYGIDLTHDFELNTMLALHITPLLHRLEYDLKFSNPLITQIKNDSYNAYEMAVLAGNVITKKYGKKVSEHEIGYLALHFSLALERIQKPVQKNIIIVCASGVGTSQILLYKIKSKFKDCIDQVMVLEAYELEKVNQDDFDFILTTIPLQIQTQIPTLQVQYFLNQEDMVHLQNLFAYEKKDDFVERCFRKEYFYKNVPGKTKEEVIYYLCEQISKVYPLPDSFYTLVLEREDIASTEIGNHVAMPHPLHLVHDDTFVAIGVLDKPIKWIKSEVKYVFLLCINKDEQENLTHFNEALASLVTDVTFLNQLDHCEDFDSLNAFFSLASKQTSQVEESIFQ